MLEMHSRGCTRFYANLMSSKIRNQNNTNAAHYLGIRIAHVQHHCSLEEMRELCRPLRMAVEQAKIFLLHRLSLCDGSKLHFLPKSPFKPSLPFSASPLESFSFARWSSATALSHMALSRFAFSISSGDGLKTLAAPPRPTCEFEALSRLGFLVSLASSSHKFPECACAQRRLEGRTGSALNASQGASEMERCD